MYRLNVITPRQIGNYTCQLEDSMISTRRQIQLRHRRPHQALTLILQLAGLSYLPHVHICVANNARGAIRGEALVLNIPRGLDTSPNTFRCPSYSIPAQLFIINSWNFDMDIDAIQQGT